MDFTPRQMERDRAFSLVATPLVQMIINHFGIKIPCGVLSHISLFLQESEIYLTRIYL